MACANAQLVTYPNGAVAPAETLEVQAAKASHFAAHGALYHPYAYHHGLYAGAYAHHAYAYAHPYYYGYNPLVAHANGAVVPLDEPAVAAAKAEHFAAHATPLEAPVAPAFEYSGLVSHGNGALVPEEPAEVVQARADHLANF